MVVVAVAVVVESGEELLSPDPDLEPEPEPDLPGLDMLVLAAVVVLVLVLVLVNGFGTRRGSRSVSAK